MLAVCFAGWLHELTAAIDHHGRQTGWGTRDGKAMIETLRRQLGNVSARFTTHGGN